MLTSGLQAGLGSIAWILAARLFSAAAVGEAGTLVTAAVVGAYLALLGLNTAFVRYLPAAPDRDALITAGLLLAGAGGAVIGLLYVLLLPLLAPRLAFVGHHPLFAAGFVLFTAAGAVNLLTDSAFIGYRRAGCNAVADGLVGGLAKMACVALAAGAGGYGLFCASASGFAAAGLASVVLLRAALGYRPALRRPVRTLRPLVKFSAASYAGNLGNLLPDLIVPLIVLDRLGAPAAACYCVAFSVATLLYSASFAVEQTCLAEGSQPAAARTEVMRRSGRVLLGLCLPACAAFVLAAHWVLLAFGDRYSRLGTTLLIVLALAGPPLAVNNWLQALLRLAGRPWAAAASAAGHAVLTCALAWLLASRGLTALAAAWPGAALAGAAGTALAGRALLRGRGPAPAAGPAAVAGPAAAGGPAAAAGRARLAAGGHLGAP